MKNERIHELDKRLILMETVVCGGSCGGGVGGVKGDAASGLCFLSISSVECAEGRPLLSGMCRG